MATILSVMIGGGHVAHADPNYTGIVPAGSIIITPSGQRHELAAARFVVTRKQIDAANVLARTEPVCQQKLTRLTIDYARLVKPRRSTGLVAAARMGAKVLVVAGAFLLGLHAGNNL